jgi:addiction module HigA family antidote
VTAKLQSHPGQVLLEEVMQPLGVSRAQLARDIDVPIDRLRAVIVGRVGINADLALRLGRHFGTSAELWMKLQTDYDLATARAGPWRQLERRIRIFGVTPRIQSAADPIPEGATPPKPEEVEPAVHAETVRPAEASPPVSAEAEPAAAAPEGGPRLNGEEPLELTELVEPVVPSGAPSRAASSVS